MRILSLNFSLYTIGGMWRPIEWSSTRSRLLYNLLTFLSIYSLLFLLLTQFFHIIFVDTMEERTMNYMLCLSSVSVLMKAATVIFRRERILDVIRILEETACRACNKEETDIQMNFDRLIRSHSIRYLLMCMVSLMGGVTGALLDASEGKLPYSMSVPYDYSSSLLYWFTVLQETLAISFGAIVNVAVETSVLGFCLQTCAQFEILKHRLESMVKYNSRIREKNNCLDNSPHKLAKVSEYVSHHLSIIRIAEMINDIFSEMIFVQFFVSGLVICSCLYHLSSRQTITDISTMIAFIVSMFVQIFIYCWAGNEVTLKSRKVSDDVYQTDWTLMTVGEQRDLLMIMRRSLRSIKFSSGFFVTMSLDSYTNLLKASYSAFNVLQQS